MKRKMLLRRLCSLLFAGLLFVGLLPADGVMKAYAEGSVQTITNVVVFVRLHGDETDGFNEPDTTDPAKNKVWESIRGIYNDGWPGPGGEDNSFSSYIRTISNGKVQVQNVFPQVNKQTGQITPYTLQNDYPEATDASGNSSLVAEVVKALADAQNDSLPNPLRIDADIKLNNRYPDTLDNLTIILQGDTFNGNKSSYKADYAGPEKVCGVVVRNYNAMPLDSLLKGTQQGLVSHEFLHTLGLRDLYRSSGDGDPVGRWDIMASVPRCPQYPLGYQRKFLGWLNEPESLEVTESGTYELTAVSHSDGTKPILITIKTPLSESNSETICLEYRIQESGSNKFDSWVPQTGVIMYRVDTKFEENRYGQNYIYVYRPNVTTPEGASDKDGNVNRINKAALTTSGASYGTTDLSDDYKKNTLYYSTERNSGVQVSILGFSENTVKIKIDFAEYGDSWQAAGGTAATDAYVPKLYADETGGKLYLGYVNGQKQLYVKQWNAETNTWTQLGSVVGTLAYPQEPSLAAYGGKLYAAFLDSGSNPAYAVWEGRGWSSPVKISTDFQPKTLQLVTDGSGIYAAYQTDGSAQNHIKIYDLNGTQIAESIVTAEDFSNPTVVKDGSKFYIAYSKFRENTPAQINSYDMTTGTWTLVYTYKAASGNTNLLCAKNGRLYAVAGGPAASGGASPALAVWDGTKWMEMEIPDAGNFYGSNLIVAGQTPYVSFFDNTSGKAQMLRVSEGRWESCYDGLSGSVDYFQAANISTQVYVALEAPGTHTVNVYAQKVTLAPDDPTGQNQPAKPEDPVTPPPTDPVTPPPTDPVTPPSTDPVTPPSTDPVTPPAAQSPTLRLTPPSGYTDTKIYVDGVAYNAQKSGDSLTVQLPNTSGKIATMYFYNENGVPKGMYVWRLSFSGNTCTATALPGLQDLISYHGFSIRVQSPAGIRFKSGIDTDLRARLLSGDVDGYKLKEYGTMSMAASNMGQYPFVLGQSKVRTGQSYWTENGVVNDRVLETVSGRHRFASVIINIPQQQYASDIAFRAYAVLQDASGREVTVYGPYVTRSVYTVAQQVAAAGEFPPGSSGYEYVQGIIQAAIE